MQLPALGEDLGGLFEETRSEKSHLWPWTPCLLLTRSVNKHLVSFKNSAHRECQPQITKVFLLLIEKEEGRIQG